LDSSVVTAAYPPGENICDRGNNEPASRRISVRQTGGRPELTTPASAPAVTEGEVFDTVISG
jgi:hypothetical protein